MICRKTSITAWPFVMIMVLAVLLIVDGASAVPIEEWNMTFGGTGVIISVQQTSDGGYFLVGTLNIDTAHPHAWLMKTDVNGNKQWNKTIIASEETVASFGQQTSDGGFILAGYTRSYTPIKPGYDSQEENAWLMKTDANGNEQWKKRIDVAMRGYGARYVKQISDGGYILIGTFYLNNASILNERTKDIYLIKTDSSGNEKWRKIFGGEGTDLASSVQQTSDGGYILSGYNSSVTLFKTDENGNEQWRKTFGDCSECSRTQFYYAQQTLDGGYVLVKADTLIKLDKKGNQEWSKEFGDKSSLETIGQKIFLKFVEQTSDDGYILSGVEIVREYPPIAKALLIKTDKSGNQEWNKSIDGQGTDWSIFERDFLVHETSDRGYIIAGYDKGETSQYNADAWLIKLKGTGAIDVTNPKGSRNSAPDLQKADEKSIPGFEIFGATFVLSLIYLIKRKA